MRVRSLAAALAVGALAISGCSSSSGTSSTSAAADSNDKTYDISNVKKVDDIAALLPDEIAKAGKIVVGTSPDYAPGEFRSEDLETEIGYDMDLIKAVGKVLGVDVEISPAQFDSIMPGVGVGKKYDVAISSFTITEERTQNYNLISYISVGSSYAVAKGNPNGFDPADVCGKSIAVQTGTWQEEELGTFTTDCTDAGKEAIEVLSYGTQSDATTNVIGGKADAFYADSTVSGYAVTLTNGQMEVVGDVREAAPQGIVVNKADAELTDAVQKATQSLMDDGTWPAIAKAWGNEDAALTTAEVNPTA